MTGKRSECFNSSPSLGRWQLPGAPKQWQHRGVFQQFAIAGAMATQKMKDISPEVDRFQQFAIAGAMATARYSPPKVKSVQFQQFAIDGAMATRMMPVGNLKNLGFNSSPSLGRWQHRAAGWLRAQAARVSTVRHLGRWQRGRPIGRWQRGQTLTGMTGVVFQQFAIARAITRPASVTSRTPRCFNSSPSPERWQ